VVEIGSRAVRLLVADVSPDLGLRMVGSDWEEAHLAAAVATGGTGLSQTIEKVSGIVERFLKKAREMNTSHVAVVATEAVRRMPKHHLKQLSGLLPQMVVLKGRAEAYFSLLAAVKGTNPGIFKNHDVLVIDQGAGSLELAKGHIENGELQLIGYKSYSLGTQVLVGVLRKENGNFSRLRDYLERRISASRLIGMNSPGPVFILGSAATKLAWIKVRKDILERYNPRKVHGQVLNLSSVDSMIKMAMEKPTRVRHLIDPRNPDGEEFETVLSGLVALSTILEKLGKREFIVSALGVRHGVAWELATRGSIDYERSAHVKDTSGK
jgi:exopolyphosphatase/pppGpp-phosphohydrolase